MPYTPKQSEPQEPEETSAPEPTATDTAQTTQTRKILWALGLAVGLYWIVTGLWGVLTQGGG